MSREMYYDSIETKRRKRWAHVIPSLDEGWTHWWLEGDGGLLLITDDLLELLDKVEESYGKNLRIVCIRARHNDEGDLIAEEKRDFIVADYQKDQICEQAQQKGRNET